MNINSNLRFFSAGQYDTGNFNPTTAVRHAQAPSGPNLRYDTGLFVPVHGLLEDKAVATGFPQYSVPGTPI